jgi:hypothetical protein
VPPDDGIIEWNDSNEAEEVRPWHLFVQGPLVAFSSDANRQLNLFFPASLRADSGQSRLKSRLKW